MQRLPYQQNEIIPWGIDIVRALDVDDKYVSNQKVCIIDTGYDMGHPDLPNSNGITGSSQIPSQPWNRDGNGHGSHIAGTIAAIGGNKKGVVGINRNGQIKLHIVKIFNDDGLWTHQSDLIKAVESCVAEGSTIITMSLGGPFYSNTENQAYKRIFNNQGILLVAAAGNAGSTDKSYPASYSSVISVAAINKNKKKWTQYILSLTF